MAREKVLLLYDELKKQAKKRLYSPEMTSIIDNIYKESILIFSNIKQNLSFLKFQAKDILRFSTVKNSQEP